MNGTIPQTPAAAPSAAPAPATPATPVATMPAAPSAPELDPSNLAYYDRLASTSLLGTEPAAPAAALAPGNGSPPAATPAAAPLTEAPVAPAAAAPAPPAAAPAAPVQTSEPPAAPAAEGEEPEPTAEEQAGWSDSEKRIHGALKKEREKGKEARRELKELREKLDKLVPSPEAPAQPTTPQPAQPPRAIEECNTPQAVEYLTVQAIAMEGKATRWQGMLQRNNTTGAIQALKAEGKDKIGETPIEEATPEQLTEYVTSVQEGARFIQAQAEPRKRWLNEQAVSWNAATRLIPELATNPKSERAQRYVQLVQNNAWLRQQGSNWPVIAAKYLIGDERSSAPAATPAAATVPTPIPTPAPLPPTARPAPAAPRTAPAAAPKVSEVDTIRAKMAAGTATAQEVDRYAALALNAPAAAAA